jgi:excinuclease ABC subunit C
MTLEEIKNFDIPTRPGSYQFYDQAGVIIYVGKAANLKSRVLSYWQKSTTHSPAKAAMMKSIEQIKWIETDSEIEALLLESNFIKRYQPQFNVLMRDDKRYAYVKISLEDEVPGVFVVRTIDKSGKYYGPFTSGGAVLETLKTIRKIWPYCTERKIKSKPCFYYHVGRCTGVCGGIITRKEYIDKIIKPIELFFEGKKERIVKSIKHQVESIKKELAKKNISSEQKADLESLLLATNYQLLNMRNVLEHANVLGLLDKYATDVVELAKVLGLPKTPQRIEGYDISNNFGAEAVGSMVVFAEGEPNKNEYRKFKIKINPDLANDTGMLREVLTRRLNNDWPLPDLMIIDGGKGQVSAVTAILKKAKLDIQVIGISKGEGLRSAIAPDKLFFPGQKKALSLPLASPALHLIKRVRDEAHRFAIGYHRDLRSRGWLVK